MSVALASYLKGLRYYIILYYIDDVYSYTPYMTSIITRCGGDPI